MPTSAKSKTPKHAYFYAKSGKRMDADLHNPILDQGKDGVARHVSRKVAQRLGLTSQQIDALMGARTDKNDWKAIRVRAERQRAEVAREYRQRMLMKQPGHDVSDQPRDEHGRFSSGGGGGDGGGEAAKPAAKPGPAEAHAQRLAHIVDSVPGAQREIDSAAAKIAKAKSTDSPVSEGGFKRPDGHWTASRQKAHAEILEGMLTADKVAAAIPKPGEQPVVHLLGGSGGSGKGWYTSPKGTVKLDNAIYLNSDDVKAALPGYEGWNASLLHEESSEVSRTIEGLVRTAKLNVVIDGTMGNPEMLEKRIAQYKAVGYRVEGHFMRVTPETSVKRALERFVRGSEAARKANPGTSKTGRFVLPDVIFSNKATQSFARMRDKMDNWEIYDNEGTSPVFVESKSRPKK